ncbi:MAG: hypothetical protein HDS07_00570 [Bacteroides sp.]|nr:hypothetical protein [Bacteroides sp.]
MEALKFFLYVISGLLIFGAILFGVIVGIGLYSFTKEDKEFEEKWNQYEKKRKEWGKGNE